MTTTVLTWILVGLVAGGTAWKTVSDGGYGLPVDLALGIAGSALGSVMLWTFGPSGAGVLPMAVAAVVGAGSTIIAQRSFWAAPTVVRRAARAVPKARR
jgi:uncharacterized membrane protein YeaQ/YmgE (transglycosylase-associated protein family)